MGFKVKRIRPETPSGLVEVGERVYLDASGKATKDPQKATSLFAVEGDRLTEEAAREVGLIGKDAKDGKKSKGDKAE